MSTKPSFAEQVVFVYFGIALGIALNGQAFRMMWQWFAAPLGAPSLSLPIACGLFVMTRYVCDPRRHAKVKWTSDGVKETFWKMLGPPIAVLIVGWPLSLFVRA